MFPSGGRLAIVALTAVAIFLASQFAPIWARGVYLFTYYASLPWSFPWFDPPFQPCLPGSCAQGVFASGSRLVGFAVNFLLVYAGLFWLVSRVPRNKGLKR